jgi:hypothetical protein
MSFGDPIVGGTVLRTPAIQSPNYVPGVSGWIIRIDGSAEFANLTIRGQFNGTDFIIDSSGIFFYSGVPANGNLAVSLAFAAGTDSFGNTYPSGLDVQSAGKSIVLGLTGGSPLLYFVTGLAATFNSAALQGIIQGAGTGQYDWLQILSAQDSTQNTLMLAALSGASADGTIVPGFHVQYKDAGGVFHELFEISPTGIALNLPVSIESEIIQTFTADATPMLMQANTTVASTNGFIQQTHFSTGSVAWKQKVNGDTSSRWVLLADGSMQWGPGNAGQDTMFKRSAAGVMSITQGSFSVTTAGQGLAVKEGANAKQGTATLAAGTVVVSNTSVTANSRIFLTAQTSGAAPGALRVSARTAGTSFTITSTSGTDTSLVAYQIFEPA